jgi:hypothetical protein
VRARLVPCSRSRSQWLSRAVVYVRDGMLREVALRNTAEPAAVLAVLRCLWRPNGRRRPNWGRRQQAPSLRARGLGTTTCLRACARHDCIRRALCVRRALRTRRPLRRRTRTRRPLRLQQRGVRPDGRAVQCRRSHLAARPVGAVLMGVTAQRVQK